MRALSLVLLLTLAGCLPVQRALVDRAVGQRRDAAGLAERTAEVNGLPVAYLERPGTEPALVLVHGFGAEKDGWLGLVTALKGGRRILAPDLAGHGDSPAEPGARYDARRYAADVAAFLDAIGAERVDLSGNSMGGLVATIVALEHPDRVRSLVLLDPSGVPSPTPSGLDSLTATGTNPLVPTNRAEYDRLLAFAFARPPDLPGPARNVLAAAAARRAPFLRDLFRNLGAERGSLLARLPEIEAPTLLLWGAADRVLDVSAAPLWTRALPNARLVVLDGVGHGPMMEVPEETARLMDAFLDAQ